MGCASGSTLPIDQVAIDAPIRRREEQWFAPDDGGAPPSPWRTPRRLDVAYARLEQTEVAEAMGAWWLDRLARLARAGIAGFRCLDPDHAPASLWRRIIGGLKRERCRFLAWTPGVERSALPRLEGVGFDHVCSSLPWWDGRANWLVEEVEVLRRIAPVMASPEASFFERRAARLAPGSDIGADYRLALRLAAATGSGMFVPMGFEYAARRPFDAALGGPDDFRRARDEAPADLTADLAAANALVDHIAEYRVDGEMRQLTDAQDRCHGAAALRCAGPAQRVTRRDGPGQSRYRPRRAARPVGFAAAATGRRGLGVGGDARGCGCADGPGRGACSRLCADATRDPSGGPRRGASSVPNGRRADRHRGNSSAGPRTVRLR